MRHPSIAFAAVAVLGAAAAALPAIAGSETVPAIEAVNVGGGVYGEEHHWSPPQVAVPAGGAVALSNPTEVRHGVYWVGGPATPSCSSGVPVGSSETASGTKWSGTCTFSAPGVYTFYCTVHGPAMTGRVTVTAAATTGTPAPAPIPTQTASAPSPPTGGEAGGSAGGGPPATALRLAPASRGRGVSGSLSVSSAAAGARLEVDLLARAGSRLVRIGRLVRTHVHAGRLSFAVVLDAHAARSLAVRRRLAVTVVVLVRPPQGAVLRLSRRLLLRA